MIRQVVGDLLEIHYEGRYYYVVVLTKIVKFGGNILFAHHTEGIQQPLAEIIAHRKGFNVCADLIIPKRDGGVQRLHRYDDVSEFWLTRHFKSGNAYEKGQKATKWLVYSVDDIGNTYLGSTEYKRLPSKYHGAMDSGTYNFPYLTLLIQRGYSPDQNEHL